MALVKLGKISKEVDMSETTIFKLIKEEVFVKGKHYFEPAHLGYRLFDTEAILKWAKGQNEESKKMKSMAERLVG